MSGQQPGKASPKRLAGPRQTWLNCRHYEAVLFTLTFAVSVRNGGGEALRAAFSLPQQCKLWSSSTKAPVLQDNLVIHRKDPSRHELIRDRDSGQIEALDRDYAKASSGSQSAPYPSTDGLSPVLISFAFEI